MKKILSFVLAALLLVSAVPTVSATNDYSQGTQVVYEATGSESYTITVPAQLAPGGSGTVTLSGTWADNRVVTVTADPTVTLTNSIKAEDQKVLNVHFDGISEAGSNTASQTFTQGISVDGITDALFGTWSGKFNYNVEIANVAAETGCDTLYWDGNTEGLTCIAGNYYKVSDTIITVEDLEQYGIELTYMDGELYSHSLTADDVISAGLSAIFPNGIMVLDGLVFVSTPNSEFAGISASETGIYFFKNSETNYWQSIRLSGYTGFPHSEHCGH